MIFFMHRSRKRKRTQIIPLLHIKNVELFRRKLNIHQPMDATAKTIVYLQMFLLNQVLPGVQSSVMPFLSGSYQKTGFKEWSVVKRVEGPTEARYWTYFTRPEMD